MDADVFSNHDAGSFISDLLLVWLIPCGLSGSNCTTWRVCFLLLRSAGESDVVVEEIAEFSEQDWPVVLSKFIVRFGWVIERNLGREKFAWDGDRQEVDSMRVIRTRGTQQERGIEEFRLTGIFLGL
jgi:hypothetical protein